MTKSRTLIPRFVFTEWPKVEKILGPRPSELFPKKYFFLPKQSRLADNKGWFLQI